jgi:hypothetical protein
MSDATCSVEGCDRKAVARALCMMHYQRMRGKRPLMVDLPETVTCASCLDQFKPKNLQQKYCSRQCGVNLRVREHLGYPGPIARQRVCEACDATFDRSRRQKFCSPKCAQFAGSLARDISRR